MMIYYKDNVKNTNYKLRPLFTTKASPDFIYGVDSSTPYGFISIPMFCQISNIPMDYVIFSRVLI